MEHYASDDDHCSVIILKMILMTLQMTHHLLYLPSYVAAGVLLIEVSSFPNFHQKLPFHHSPISTKNLHDIHGFIKGIAAKCLVVALNPQPRHLHARLLAGSGW